MKSNEVINFSISLLVCVLFWSIIPALAQWHAWRAYPNKSVKEKIKIGFWNLKYLSTSFGMVHQSNFNMFMFISFLANVKQVPKYTAWQMMKEKPKVYEILWERLKKKNTEVTKNQFIKELQQVELELLKSSSSKKRRKKKVSVKSTRRRSIHPRKKSI